MESTCFSESKNTQYTKKRKTRPSYAQASVYLIRMKHIFREVKKKKKTMSGEKTKRNIIMPLQKIQPLDKMLKKLF